MDREQFEMTSQLERVGMVINVAQDFPIARMFLDPAPPQSLFVKVYQRMRNDPESQIIFLGSVKSCVFEDEEARLNCESIQAQIRKQGLQRAHSRTCNHVLYDAQTCRVDNNSFSSTGTVATITADKQRITVIPSPTRPADYFTTGELTGASDRVMILSDTVVGSTHTLDFIRPLPNLAVGSPVTIYAGCKRTFDVCISKFNNSVNYGGFPFAPTVNPFESGLR
jgi:uncharacterized phage protein (TIGR02218 family)